MHIAEDISIFRGPLIQLETEIIIVHDLRQLTLIRDMPMYQYNDDRRKFEHVYKEVRFLSESLVNILSMTKLSKKTGDVDKRRMIINASNLGNVYHFDNIKYTCTFPLSSCGLPEFPINKDYNLIFFFTRLSECTLSLSKYTQYSDAVKIHLIITILMQIRSLQNHEFLFKIRTTSLLVRNYKIL